MIHGGPLEYKHTAAFLLACVAIGWLLDNVAAVLCLGLLLVLFLWHRDARRLHKGLQKGKETREPVFGPLEPLRLALQESATRRRERANMLHSSLNRFRRTTDTLPDAVLLLNQEGVIEWSNRGARKHLRIRRRDRGHRLQHLLRQPELNLALRECKQGAPQELRLPGTSGTLELRLLPLDPDSILLLARDVTAAERLEQVRKAFIANLSHELRTPLTVLSGFLEEWSQDTPPKEFTQALPAMRREVQRMRDLCEQLLHLSRLESDNTPSEKVIVPMSELLQEVIESLRHSNHSRGQRLELRADPNLKLRGAPSELYSAVSNLIMNALQYTPAETEIQIHWGTAASPQTGAILEVRDQGNGIAPEHLPLLTQRFYRVDHARSSKHGNLGLGLAIVKHVLLRHNAVLRIKSRLGQGSSFQCDFPSARVLVTDPSPLAQDKDAPPSSTAPLQPPATTPPSRE